MAIAGLSATGGLGNIVVVSDTGATITGVSMWNYLPPGVITSVTPNFGQYGTNVAISFSSFGDNVNVSSVTLGGSAATIISQDSTSVHIVANSHSAGFGDVVIRGTSGATITLVAGFHYLPLGHISSIQPGAGQTGTIVTVCGTDLLSGAASFSAIMFGSETATILQQNTTCIVAQLP